MNKADKITTFLEKVFWIFLFVNPFLDIINGIYINMVMGVDILDVKFVSTLGVTPSLVLRMIMLVVFACYVILVKDRRSIFAAIPIGLAWLLSMVSEYLYLGGVQLFLDTQYTARFCFNIVLLMVYTRVFFNKWGTDGKSLIDGLDTVVAFTLVVLSFSILASAVSGVGYSTYADRLGYRGSRGFFYAGNDITAILALLLPLAIAKLMKLLSAKASAGRFVLFAAAVGLGANALLIIGSKTAFIAFAVSFALLLLFALFSIVKDKSASLLAGFGIAAGSAIVVFAVLMLLSNMALWESIVNSFNVTGELAENEGVETAILSGREIKLSEHLTLFKNGGPIVWLFGIGRGSQEAILEMDIFEVFFYFGIFGAVAMLWLYAKVGFEFLKSFFKKLDVTSVAIFASLAMCTGYLIIAGHVLFSVTSGFYYAFVIAYSRSYLAKERKEALLWRSEG